MMAEDASQNESNTTRIRRACLNCYEKKIKCDYSDRACGPYKKNRLECKAPNSDAPKPRRSIRATVEDLESRVLSLEGSQAPWSAVPRLPKSGLASLASTSPKLQAELINSGISITPSSETFSVPFSRGMTSPWSTLLSGTSSNDVDLQPFHETATAIAKSESSILMSKNSIPYSMFGEVLGLSPSQITGYARNYACSAPYPILHWDSLLNTLQSLVQQQRTTHIGQVACVWIYMAFGAAHTGKMKSDTVANNEPGLYFQKAWGLLPQFLLDYDLWALKAVTLMVHYLQACAKPQTCWALLGTALRLAVSLGFDRNDSNILYSKVEQEEGRRAFWLCCIMEKSLCINLGHPSSFHAKPTALTPEVFRPFDEATGREDDIFGGNEDDAVIFFRQMIDLTWIRDELYAALDLGTQIQQDVYQRLLQRLREDIRSGSSTPDSTIGIRACIHDLAYYNTIQVLATTHGRWHNRGICDDAIRAARTSLDLISESQRSGKLMCLWMWLYYAFTSAVVLFLHSIANPLDRETTLNLAAISDLENICSGVAEISEGAGRCMEIAKAMRSLILKIVKIAGRKRGRDDSFSEAKKSRRTLEPEPKVQPQDTDISGGSESGVDHWQQPVADSNAILQGAPMNFAWDEWDKWLEDVDWTGGEGP